MDKEFDQIRRIKLENANAVAVLMGNNDENARVLEDSLGVRIIAGDGEIIVAGSSEAADRSSAVIEELISYYEAGNPISRREIDYVIGMARDNKPESLSSISDDIIYVTPRGKQIRPKTVGQKHYVQAIAENDIVFGIGPAGTGKTYLAVAMAVKILKNQEVSRIIITRPAVEAGEKLGFLPGDLQEKINPYLRPIYDSLNDVLGIEAVNKYLERGVIEIAPLAYMRGRTLDDAFIILDEAQNTTREQMKMLLTRIGFNSRAVITGDVTQIDLPRDSQSGLVEAIRILRNIDEIKVFNLSEADIVRHRLVQKIIEAYDKFERKTERSGERKNEERRSHKRNA